MKYGGPIIDVDVHHTYVAPSDLIEYLATPWKSLLHKSSTTIAPVSRLFPTAIGNYRLESYGEDGQVPGSSPERIRTQLLYPHNVERAILNYSGGGEVAHHNGYLGSAVATALNNWSLDRWLNGTDDRLYGALIVSNQNPIGAAAEIRRIGDRSRFVAVYFSDGGLGQPFGHPVYHPIYDAAAEYGFPVTIHVGAPLWNGVAHMSAGGLPSNHFEYQTLLIQGTMHHLTSFITHGVFEKWPSLAVVLLEGGFNWVPWLFNQLDTEFPRLRRESPWVKRLPSEYLLHQVRFSTQPLEAPPDRSGWLELLGTLDGIENFLMFASDYPHWDADEADLVAQRLPAAWHSKVFYENALMAFRWPPGASTVR